jgi:hypothetical protein
MPRIEDASEGRRGLMPRRARRAQVEPVASFPAGVRWRNVQRILDLDLDFFVRGVAHWRAQDAARLDAEEYPPWTVRESVDFLRSRCGLTGPLPGAVVENHGELFFRWRDAIDAGKLAPPFHVTHVDGHAFRGAPG